MLHHRSRAGTSHRPGAASFPAPDSVIQRPRRTTPARTRDLAGRRILHGARMNPGAAAGTVSDAAACWGE
ncbi:MAG: hypothetical protein AVDCRST_MAG89-1856 [uncultured Gemmatimonadetes bacterium]|uniref:Uncharacterized protein n=1 Tax=uncultured Gemmatimonadota bacterium TaxID=203437 RepID=A0A6J4L7K6_9BACT|nr:MAG: hypothetical protein AVDCRST_MAG89-1856 [uncultured Gemmatimonadota bacterium]